MPKRAARQGGRQGGGKDGGREGRKSVPDDGDKQRTMPTDRVDDKVVSSQVVEPLGKTVHPGREGGREGGKEGRAYLITVMNSARCQ